MKRYRKYIVLGVITLIVLLIGWGIASSRNKPAQYTTAPVTKGDLVQTVEATGSVASAEDLELSFKSQGRIRQIAVSVGDHVTKGTTLASIGDASVASQVDRARATVLSAQADLDKLLSGAKPTDLAVTTEEINKAKVDLDSASAAVANLRLEQARTLQDYENTALQTMVDTSFVADYTIDVVFDGILDTEADSHFNTTKTAALESAKVRYGQAITHLQSAKQFISTAQEKRTTSDLLNALNALKTTFDSISTLLDASFESLSGAIANAVYAQATIDSLRSSFNTRATAVATAKTSIQSSIQDFTKGIQDMNTDIDAAVFKEKSAEQAVALAQAKYNAQTAKPQSYEIQQQEAKVLQAEADLRAAQSAVSDTVITAPVDGTITKLDAKAGEVASPSQAVVHMIGDSKLQIDVDIPESDITKVAVDQPVTITLDAFSADTVFNGTVSFIEPTQRLIQDVVYYRVTVVFNEVNDDIKPGMTASIRIRTAERSGVLTVPVRAVTVSLDGEKSVRILGTDGAVTTKTVTTGIRGDEGTVEIFSGLAEGDQVIIGETK